MVDDEIFRMMIDDYMNRSGKGEECQNEGRLKLINSEWVDVDF